MRKGQTIDEDRTFIGQAVAQALKGRGEVEPNPMVGAVVVKNGRVLAKSYHARYGAPHAEVRALRKAGREAAGATIYVTLEPCSTRGKTPPCTGAILAAGVRRVVVGYSDPDPRHQGKGLDVLAGSGMEVVLQDDTACKELLHGFDHHLAEKTPHVILKWAMTLDGRIAAKDGSSAWISSKRSRDAVHSLRGHVDAVLVGSGTVLADNPRLNCRKRKAPLVPVRVVLDTKLEIPEDSRLVSGAKARKDEEGFKTGPVWILTAPGHDPDRARALQNRGAEVIPLSASPLEEGLFLSEAMAVLRKRGIHRLLVEGGSRLFTGLIESCLADQVCAYISPKIVGGRTALSPVEGEGKPCMSEAIVLSDTKIRRSGDDAWLNGFFECHSSS